MLRTGTRVVSTLRRIVYAEDRGYYRPAPQPAFRLLCTTTVTGREARVDERAGRSRLEVNNSNFRSSSGGGYQRGTWKGCDDSGFSASAAVATALAVAVAIAELRSLSAGSTVLQEQGPVPGGPILEGDDEDAFQRFPSGSRVHHAIKLARQNTARERRRYYQYVIVGAGTTAKAAIEAILAEDPQADILLLTDEVCLPAGDVYKKERPLPQDLLGAYNEWRRHVSARLENEPKAFSSIPMTLLLGRKRLRLDPQKRSLVLDDGTEVFFDKCLLATAGKPRQFYVLDYEKTAYQLRGRINTLASLADFESLDLIGPSLGCVTVAAACLGEFDCPLQDLIQSIDGDVCTPLVRTSAETKQMQSCLQRAHTPNRVIFSVAGCIVVKADVIVGDRYRCKEVAVVGGGFLGTEVALAMANRGMKVWQVYAEAAPLCRHLPLYLAEYVKRKLHRHGVEPVAERLVTDVRGGEDNEDMDLEKITMSMMGLSKESITTDYLVMASTHVDPVVDVARESGLEIDPVNGGVVVNGQLEAVSGIYAAGACASYYDQALGRRRADILEHGVRSGWLAGYNMAVTSLASKRDQDPRQVLLTEYEEGNPSSTLEDPSGTPVGAKPHARSSSAGLGRSGPDVEGLAAPPAGAVGLPWKGLHHPCMYRQQPAFKSRLEDVDITVDGVGEIDSRTRTVGVWVEGTDAPCEEGETGNGSEETKQVVEAPPTPSTSATDVVLPGMPHAFDRGIVYYLHGSQVVGIVLWNASDLVDKARDIINNQPAISSVEELKTLIALAPDDWLRVVETSTVSPPIKRRRAR